MPKLADIQYQMRDTILSGSLAPTELIDIIAENGISADRRLQIHRNNFRETLSSALLEVFPVAKVFVGEAFLKAVLAKFVLASPPTAPVLSSYGVDFADFLANFAPAARLPYLPDITRLEWAVHDLQNAFEVTETVQKLSPNDTETVQNVAPVDTETVQVLAPALQFSKNARMIDSDYPLLTLWMVGKGQLPPEAANLDSGGECVIALLGQGEVRLMSLNAPQRVIAKNLVSGQAIDNSIYDSQQELMKSVSQLVDMGLLHHA